MPIAHLTWIKNYLLDVDPTLYLDEIREKLMVQFSHHENQGRYPLSVICVTLIKAGITRKKLSKVSLRRNQYVRHVFREVFFHEDPSRFIFIDESQKDPFTLYRDHGRGPIGERVERQVEFTRATRGYSVLAFMTLDGIIGHTITHASGVTAEKFTYDITHVLLPLLRSDSIVIMDNASIHHSAAIKNLIETHCQGCQVVYLPPYSFDLNPIEQALSKLKAYLQRNREESRSNPRMSIRNGLSEISSADAAGWFQNCGYVVTEVLPGFWV